MLTSALEEIERLSLLDEIELPPAETLRLLMAIGAIITKTCGSHTKLHEKTTQLRLTLGGTESVHVKHSYGADLRIKEGDAFIDVEVKSSDVKKGASYKTNWVFQVSATATLESLSRQYSGEVRLVAIYGNTVLASYTLSGRFISQYLMRCLTRRPGKRLTVNLGAIYCEHHKTYHRIEKYMRYDLLTKERALTEEEWHDLFSTVTATHSQ